MSENLPSKSQFIIYQTESGQTKIDVRFENETVWLSQKLLAELFQKDVRTINEHIRNIYEENELDQNSTIRNFRIVQNEGAREVAREVEFYNLDMILSVGYRIKSKVATHFRQWATRHLREYIVKGFVLDDERFKNRRGAEKRVNRSIAFRTQSKYYSNITPATPLCLIRWANAHLWRVFIFIPATPLKPRFQAHFGRLFYFFRACYAKV